MPRAFNRKRKFSSQTALGNWISTYKKIKLEPCRMPYSKINSKWIEDLNLRAKTIKYIDENRGIWIWQ